MLKAATVAVQRLNLLRDIIVDWSGTLRLGSDDTRWKIKKVSSSV